MPISNTVFPILSLLEIVATQVPFNKTKLHFPKYKKEKEREMKQKISSSFNCFDFLSIPYLIFLCAPATIQNNFKIFIKKQNANLNKQHNEMNATFLLLFLLCLNIQPLTDASACSNAILSMLPELGAQTSSSHPKFPLFLLLT